MQLTKNKYVREDKLRDGRTLMIRAVRSDDKLLLKEIVHHLSPSSMYFRFLTPKRELSDKELDFFTEVDFFHHVALLASLREDGLDVPVAVGRYVVSNEPQNLHTADIAFAVDDQYQRKGIGTLLLKHLVEIARDAGIVGFTALVLSENQSMLHVFRHSGLVFKEHVNVAGVLEIELGLVKP